MDRNQIWCVGALAMLGIAVTACGSPTQSITEPTAVPTVLPTAAAVFRLTATPQTFEAPGATAVSPIAVVPTTTIAATLEPVISLEEDCMAGCHAPDPNEMIAAGAGPMPADHQGRKTCLECHAQGKGTAMPEDHLGRLDPSCKVCHAEQ